MKIRPDKDSVGDIVMAELPPGPYTRAQMIADWDVLLNNSTPEELAELERWLLTHPESIRRFVEVCEYLHSFSSESEEDETETETPSGSTPNEWTN